MVRFYTGLLALFLLYGQPAANQAIPSRDRPPASDSAGTAVIRGRVVAADTGAPIRRAQVVLVSTAAMTIAIEEARSDSGARRPEMVPRSTSTSAQGTFEFSKLPAGTYRVLARPPETAPQYISVEYGAKSSGLAGFGGGTPITVSEGQAFDNAIIALPKAAVIIGRVTDEPKNMRVQTASPELRGSMGSYSSASVSDDLTFTLKYVSGDVVLQAALPQPSWYVKSVVAGGDDITDTPRRFTGRERVTITVSTRGGTVEGSVLDDKGQPAKDSAVVFFSDDRTHWKITSVWTRRSAVSPAGKFRAAGLRPGLPGRGGAMDAYRRFLYGDGFRGRLPAPCCGCDRRRHQRGRASDGGFEVIGQLVARLR